MFKKVWGPCLERLTWAVSIFLWASTDSCLMRVAWFRLGNGHGWTTDQRKADTLYTKPSIMVVPLCFAKSCIGCVRCFHGEGSLCVPRHIQIHSNSGPIYTYTGTHPYTQCMSIQTQAGTPTEALCDCVAWKLWIACMMATRFPLCLTFLKYWWHSPCGAPCLPPSQALCRISHPGKRATLVVKRSTWLKPQKAEQSELIGIQQDAALPVSNSFPVWEDHRASRGKFEHKRRWWKITSISTF